MVRPMLGTALLFCAFTHAQEMNHQYRPYEDANNLNDNLPIGKCYKALSTCDGENFESMTSLECGEFCGKYGGRWLDPKSGRCLTMGE